MSKTILVVDDEMDVRDYLTAILEDAEYTVRTASDGFEAMESILQEKPDLITLDIMMPNETGVGFYRHLRKKKDLSDVPIIVVSGLSGRNWSISNRVTVVDKPVDKDVLLAEVAKALA